MGAAAGFRSSLTLVRKACGACRECDVRHRALCAAMADDDLHRLEGIMSPTALQPNQTLLRQGDPCRKVYSLTSGMLRLFTDLPDGRRQITGFLLPGDYLGLVDDDVHSQSAEAVVASQLCAFPIRQMELLMGEFPSLRDRLHRMTRAALRQAHDSQLMLGRLAPLEKLAGFLLMLDARANRQPRGGRVLQLAMSRTDIADHLGLTIETVSRCFTRLKMQGLIRLPDAHLVEILHEDRLADIAGIGIQPEQLRSTAC
ncbi:helix-turn-helix domain-containing protein [Labrys sp. LIt4]|uniref:helix-turn-helix domain-containing protein n=1 Tax=Labrys sp. LIt4 TaxID=2821355 RepID=UPI001ADFD294|nr:helix-turn-helix domain-containing protein [Labrys sp. LIt4]MBP0581079.1 helix-turn-helix domain-containing protein [Labrys sp. LIt4]